MEARLEGASWLVPEGAKLVVSKAKDARNPHTFVVAIGGPDLIGAVRVKVELWRAPESTVNAVKTTVSPIRLATGVAVQSMVQSAATSLDEGVRAMRKIGAQSRAEPADPSP